MEGLYLFLTTIRVTMDRFCRRYVLPAGLVLLCGILAFLTGRAAESVLTQGISFSGLVLAVTAPEGDAVPALVERYVGNMSDVRRYCRVEAMEQEEALDALEEGSVAAVLILPEDFVRGVQWGENPDVRLIVSAERPLGALLTLWIGQCASDLLASIQSGIYAVLDVYAAAPPQGLSFDRAVLEINLRYIQWILNRQDVFHSEAVLPTDALPVALHYELSLFWFLLLSLAPIYAWSYQDAWLAHQRRLRYLRRSVVTGYLSSIVVVAIVTVVPVAAVLMLLLRAPAAATCGAALLGALFFSVYAGFCGLLTGSAAGSGSLSFVLSLPALILAGGVLPPALLPAALQGFSAWSPVTWLRTLTAQAAGWPQELPAGLVLSGVTLLLAFVSVWLYRGRIEAMGECL